MADRGACRETDIYRRLAQYIKEIQYGSVTIIIQDGKIVQIEKNEKVRLA